MDVNNLVLTCVVEEGSDEGAVLEEGVGGGDVLKVALFKQGVLKYHGLHLEIQKPMTKPEEHLSALRKSTGPIFSYLEFSKDVLIYVQCQMKRIFEHKTLVWIHWKWSTVNIN